RQRSENLGPDARGRWVPGSRLVVRAVAGAAMFVAILPGSRPSQNSLGKLMSYALQSDAGIVVFLTPTWSVA
ncbi:MAG TPA: hypothetical protein VFX77_09390, partial [Rubrobacter sp.]|nr:hypothetical protein [Rubrobacter sp.]